MSHTLWRFRHPTQLVFGVDSLGQLGDESVRLGRRVMVVTYRERAGLEDVIGRVRAELRGGGLEVVDFAEIEPDPLESTGRRGAEVARTERVELVVGVGGGSAMDAAKGIAGLAVSGARRGTTAGAIRTGERSRGRCRSSPSPPPPAPVAR